MNSMRNGRLLNLIGGTILGGAVALGGGCLGGCGHTSIWVESSRFSEVLKDIKKENIYEGVCNDVGGNAVKFYDELGSALKELQKKGKYVDFNTEDYYFQIWKPKYLENKHKQSQYESELKAREDTLKAQESSKDY